MMLERIEAPVPGTHNPFVVKESDLDIFNSEDAFDFCVPTPHQQASYLQDPVAFSSSSSRDHFGGDSSSHDDFSIASKGMSRRRQRRTSVCSNSSSGSASTFCSKSINWGDATDEESLASEMEFSISSRSRRSSTSRRSSVLSGNGSSHDDMSLVENPPHSPPSGFEKQEKKVRFHRRLKIRGVPHLKDISSKELHVRWYQEEEIAQLKSDSSEIIRRAKSKEDLQGESLRGLHMSKKKQRRSLWIMALSCVLDEQTNQTSQHIHDPDTIAKLYKSFSTVSEQMAIANGKNDALQAIACWDRD